MTTSSRIAQMQRDLIMLGARFYFLKSQDVFRTPFASTEELLSTLNRLEETLSRVAQKDRRHFDSFLLAPSQALISDILFKHSDEDVRFVVASCITEIMRILTPRPFYNEEQIKEYFRLAISCYKELSKMDNRNYSKAASIVRTISFSHSCVLMLDYEMYDLIEEMFCSFFNCSELSRDEFTYNAMVKTLNFMIDSNDSDELALKIAMILLANLKKENNITSPGAFALAKEVTGDQIDNLKPYVPEAVRRMGNGVKEFDDIVASLCDVAGPGDDMAAELVEVNAYDTNRVVLHCNDGSNPECSTLYVGHGSSVDGHGRNFPSENDVSNSPLNVTAHVESSHNDVSNSPFNIINEQETVDERIGFRNLKSGISTDVRTNAQSERASGSRQEVNIGDIIIHGKRSRKPNSRFKLDECYDFYLDTSHSRRREKVPKKVDHPVKINNSTESQSYSMESSHAVASQNHFLPDLNAPINVSVGSGDNTDDQVDCLHFLSTTSNTVHETNARNDNSAIRRGDNTEDQVDGLQFLFTTSNTMHETAVRNDTVDVEGSKKEPNKDSVGRSVGRKTRQKLTCYERRKKSDTEMPPENSLRSTLITDDPVGDRIMAMLAAQSSKRKEMERRTLMTQIQAIKRKHEGKCYGNELIGRKIRVWWPDDEMFYEGRIAAYNHLTRKHRVDYDDGDEEVLDLTSECWLFAGEEIPSSDED